MSLQEVSLEDKYVKEQGRLFISGTDALVKIPLLQRKLDQQAGLNTAGFISGYRGSPLGGYDHALWKAKKYLQTENIRFQPGVNEDLAATAIWGTQQLNSFPKASVDGVFGIWYGKGPGVDRSGDVFKHANYSGTHKHGGVLVVYGDDHPGKSSTVAHQSELALAANGIPSLYPTNVEEFIEYGLLGIAMSRYTGLWVGFKCVNETVEQTATIEIDADRPVAVYPAADDNDQPDVHFVPGRFNPQAEEQMVERARLPLVHKFVKENRLNRKILGEPGATFGIISAGKSYQDLMQALQILGLDQKSAEELGISVFKVGCIWPLEPEGLKAFAHSLRQIFVVEEKKSFLEDQVKTILCNESQKPLVFGKSNEHGMPIFCSDKQLEPVEIAVAIVDRLKVMDMADAGMLARRSELIERVTDAAHRSLPDLQRSPSFCSGCPHNTSTKLPENSIAGSGIGCHGMALFSRDDMLNFTHMGAEGAQWTGVGHYVDTPHIFQNLGDGTYFHSGLLALRSAVASGVNITYKILFNDAVAMTGGQPVDGPISVGAITHQVLSEGVKRCVVVSDAPESYGAGSNLASGVDVFHRDQMDKVQKQLREVAGCTVIVYEQTCATEKRRRRKRGLMETPDHRLFINDTVCEGCGDCSVASGCVSLQPLETPLGRKRTIDQSSCNMDFSCVKGFCPSFVSVYGGQLRKQGVVSGNLSAAESIPLPQVANIDDDSFAIMIAGIGGTGVITVGSILAMAAHIEGKAASTYDMTGLAQKGGAVYSHLRIAKNRSDIHAQRIGKNETDLILAFDTLAALSGDSLQSLSSGKSQFVGNGSVTPTAGFQRDPDLRIDSKAIEDKALAILGTDRCHFSEATRIALALCGDTIATNFFLVGYAVQLGFMPLGIDAIEQAIRLNGVSVDFNLRALGLGRRYGHNPEDVLNQLSQPVPQGSTETLSSIRDSRGELLRSYQSDAYADEYCRFVDLVVAKENQAGVEGQRFSRGVAKNLAKLMAYKDEYEVARLYSSDEFKRKLSTTFDGEYSLKFNLAPPMLARKDPETGLPKKREFGGWVLPAMSLLSKLKWFRGRWCDPFSYNHERKVERELITDYRALILAVLDRLDADNYALATELAELPEEIRGYGHVKLDSVERYYDRKKHLLLEYENNAGASAVKIIESCEVVEV